MKRELAGTITHENSSMIAFRVEVKEPENVEKGNVRHDPFLIPAAMHPVQSLLYQVSGQGVNAFENCLWGTQCGVLFPLATISICFSPHSYLSAYHHA